MAEGCTSQKIVSLLCRGPFCERFFLESAYQKIYSIVKIIPSAFLHYYNKEFSLVMNVALIQCSNTSYM